VRNSTVPSFAIDAGFQATAVAARSNEKTPAITDVVTPRKIGDALFPGNEAPSRGGKDSPLTVKQPIDQTVV
jgi:hypothetical protein